MITRRSPFNPSLALLGLLVALPLTAAACGDGNPAATAGSPDAATQSGDDVEEFEVGPHKYPCQSLVTHFCMAWRKTAADPWSARYDWIEGFTPAWGVTKKVRVKVRKIANPPADGSSVAYELLAVLGESPVPAGTEFDLNFALGWAQELIVGESSALSLKNERALACPDQSVCADLDTRRKADAPMKLTLRHPSSAGEPLQVVRVADLR